MDLVFEMKLPSHYWGAGISQSGVQPRGRNWLLVLSRQIPRSAISALRHLVPDRSQDHRRP